MSAPAGWVRRGAILVYDGDLDADHGFPRDVPTVIGRDFKHGGDHGYRQHLAAGEPACADCLAGHAAAERRRAMRRRLEAAEAHDADWCGVHDCDDPACGRDVVYDEQRRELRHVETVQAVIGL